MSKIGNSRQQYLKNHLWLVWYWSSIFQRLNGKKPNKQTLKNLDEILSKNHPTKFYEWEGVYEHIYKNNGRLDIKLWNKSSPHYRDNSFTYIVNHFTGIIYVIDKLHEIKLPKEALINNAYTIYKNKFAFQQYIDNKIRKNKKPGSLKLVGRAYCPRQFIYVKKNNDIGNRIVRWNKNNFAKKINTRSNNLPHYYEKVRGHKGYWISPNSQSPVFFHHTLPKHGRYTKLK
ncbi:MAG: hypothetical protein LBF00_00135 [Mycoplasmataceae bacterium]|jgi:hypothetical protein|nr:hypothetical protein [Mycoplasmataceae bacterium]